MQWAIPGYQIDRRILMLQQPAVPASTVAYTNVSGQTAYVTVVSGTVTSINVPAGGTQVATATNYTATVANGQSIAVTYSVVPTWYWSTFTPVMPASLATVVNTTGQDISVVLAGGTTTHIAVNGTDRATTTPAQVMLPGGTSIVLTYSVAPVWAWLNFLNLDLNDSLGGVYNSNNAIPPTGVSGYSPVNALPYAQHAATGAGGFGVGIAN
jgi:hypothetical protein